MSPLIDSPPFHSAKVIISVLLAWLIAQTAKVILGAIKERRFNFRWFVGTGGMPSSHSAVASSLAMATGLYSGFSSVIFFVALVFTFVTVFDAASFRRAAGRQAAVLNNMMDELQSSGVVKEKRLKELLGHTPIEVFAGIVLGVGVAWILCR